MKFYRALGFFGISIFLIPVVTEAAVVINEVAWMGGSNSANDEWIELRNTSDASVDVSEWVLSDGMNFAITLSGTISGNSYAVLERTDDGSAPGTAFLIYTGALPNGGTTLTLLDAAGTIADQVAGGEGWEAIGGDNTTKETAQLTAAGWITAAPTPGVLNAIIDSSTESEVTIEEDDDATESKTESEPKTSGGGGSKTQLAKPDFNLQLDITGPTQVYENQPVFFEAKATGLGKVHLDSLQYRWNFGDMHTSNKKQPTHSFQYPGSYVVVLDAAYASHQGVARHEITVLPVSFSITKNDAGDIQIHNDAPYEVDLSEYVVRVGADRVTLPLRTILLAHNTLTIPKRSFNDSAPWAALYDRRANQVASTLDQPIRIAEAAHTQKLATVAATAVTDSAPALINTPPVVETVGAVLGVSTGTTQAKTNIIDTATQTRFLVPSQEPENSQSKWWLLGLFGLMFSAVMALFWLPKSE